MAPFNNELLNMIKRPGYMDRVMSIVKKENLQKTVDNSKNTLLHYAAHWNNAILTECLIDSGSRVDAQNRHGKTPLIMAVENYCNRNVVKILIKAGASIFIRDKQGNSVLKAFGDSNWKIDSEIGEILLRNCNFPSDVKKIAGILHEYKWSLPKIISLRNADITKVMLSTHEYSHYIERHLHHSRVERALCLATNSAENLKLLLNYRDAKNYMKNEYYLEALSHVSFEDTSQHPNEKIEIVKMLLKRLDSFSNNRGYIDYESIGYLLKDGCKEAVEILLQYDLDLTGHIIADADGDGDGDTVVHTLARNENPGVIELLRGKSFDVNVRNFNEETPLMAAASDGIPKAVKFLLEIGADINATDDGDETALWKAIYYCDSYSRDKSYRDCVQILLEHGANHFVRLKDDRETTIIDILSECESMKYFVSDLVLSHLALQEASGTPIEQSVRSKINSIEKYKIDFESSQRELTAKVYQSITLLDLLSANERILERYARNQEIYSKIQDFANKTCKFDYFKSLLKKCISKAIQSVELRKEVAYIICRMIKTDYERFPIIGDEIASYLGQEDMKNLLGTIFQEYFIL